MITDKQLDRIQRSQKYCTLGVYDEQTDDYLQMFRTMQQAREYCEKKIKEHPNQYSTYGIHKWNSPEDLGDNKVIEVWFYNKRTRELLVTP